MLDEGRKSGTLRFDGAPSSFARFLVSSLEGAMLVARGGGGLKVFEAAAHHALAQLTDGRRPAASRRRRQRRAV